MTRDPSPLEIRGDVRPSPHMQAPINENSQECSVFKHESSDSTHSDRCMRHQVIVDVHRRAEEISSVPVVAPESTVATSKPVKVPVEWFFGRKFKPRVDMDRERVSLGVYL